MQIIKPYAIHLSYQTLTVLFSHPIKSVVRSKYTVAWHVMHGYCAQQRSLENSRLQLFLLGGERINRTVLLYTPHNLVAASHNKNNLNYVVPAGIHLALEDLRSMGKLQNKQADYYSLPRNVLVLQRNDSFQRNAWESAAWLSRPQWNQIRQELLSLAMRLLMRRGVQSDLSGVFLRRLGQAQPSRLQNRLENFHPQSSLLTTLQQQFFRRYGELFVTAHGSSGITLFRNHVLPGLHESRRFRRRRGKLRGLMLSRGLFDLRPRLGTTSYLGTAPLLARPHQLPFLNMLMLLSRQTLRTEWRRRRGIGLLNHVLRKGGRLAWNLPVVTYAWPLRQRNLRLNQTLIETPGHPIYSTKGVLSSFQPMSLKRNSVEEREDALNRAFPFLFPVGVELAE